MRDPARVDVGELILEVMSWQPGFVEAFTAVSGGQTRLGDLHVTIAAALTAHALNVGYAPVISSTAALQPGPDQSRRPELPAGRDLRRRQPAPDRGPGRHRSGPNLGRRPGRRGRRDPVRRPGA